MMRAYPDRYGPPADLLGLVWRLAFARHWTRAALMLPADPDADEVLRILAEALIRRTNTAPPPGEHPDRQRNSEDGGDRGAP